MNNESSPLDVAIKSISALSVDEVVELSQWFIEFLNHNTPLRERFEAIARQEFMKHVAEVNANMDSFFAEHNIAIEDHFLDEPF
jgi:hypothetical protein